MYGTYCSKCNSFFYSPKLAHYCRTYGTLLMDIPMQYEEFSALSLNERYRLAYEMTEEYNKMKTISGKGCG